MKVIEDVRQDLSDGIITDIEYTLEMYGRLPNPDASPLSGTGFVGENGTATLHPSDVSANADPLGRSQSPEATKQPKANQPKSKPPVKP